MKQLTCEMCGSTDLIKDGGVFVCQTCGCKYSVEEAKKMMVEISGNVTITEPIIVQGIARSDTILENAINLFDNGNFAEAFKQTSEVLTIEPNNIRAKLYRGLSATWVCKNSFSRIVEYDEAYDTAKKAIVSAYKENAYDLLRDFMEKLTKNMVELSLDRQRHTSIPFNCWFASSQFIDALKGQISDVEYPLDFCDSFIHCMRIYTSMTAVYGLGEVYKNDPALKKFEGYFSQKKAEIERIEKETRIKTYWAEHETEKQQYEARIVAIDTELKSLRTELTKYDSQISQIKKELSQPVQGEPALSDLKRQHNDLRNQKSQLGIFAGKQKKHLQAQMDALQLQIDEMDATVNLQKKAVKDDVDTRVSALEKERKPLADKVATLEKEKSAIKAELSKDR